MPSHWLRLVLVQLTVSRESGRQRGLNRVRSSLQSTCLKVNGLTTTRKLERKLALKMPSGKFGELDLEDHEEISHQGCHGIR